MIAEYKDDSLPNITLSQIKKRRTVMYNVILIEIHISILQILNCENYRKHPFSVMKLSFEHLNFDNDQNDTMSI